MAKPPYVVKKCGFPARERDVHRNCNISQMAYIHKNTIHIYIYIYIYYINIHTHTYDILCFILNFADELKESQGDYKRTISDENIFVKGH